MYISFFDIVCLRIPAYSSKYYQISDTSLIQLVSNDDFMDGILVASPDFYRRCKSWQNGHVTDDKKINKIKLTLLKYYNRMCYRSTPFGLFSSCSTVNWGNHTDITIAENNLSPKIRVDASFLGMLIQSIEQKFSENLSYTINSSLYKVGEEYRYYEYEYHDGKREYKINAADVSDELDYTFNLLADGGLPFKMLREKISIYFETDEPVVDDYLKQLIDSQLILSTLQAKLSIDNPFKHLLITLKNTAKTSGDAELTYLIASLDKLNLALDKQPKKSFLKAHLQTLNEIAALTQPHGNEKELFQVDSYSVLNQNIIDRNIQHQLANALTVLQVLNSQNEDDEWLQSVKRKIRDKFENKPILLTHLFDPDIGINESSIMSQVNFGNNILK